MPSNPPIPSAMARRGQWTGVYDFWFALTWQTVVINTFGTPFQWRIYGSAIPFYLEARAIGFTELAIGWTGFYCHIDIRAEADTNYTVIAAGI